MEGNIQMEMKTINSTPELRFKRFNHFPFASKGSKHVPSSILSAGEVPTENLDLVH